MKFVATDLWGSYLTVSVSVQWIIGLVTSILLLRLKSDREDIVKLEERLHQANDKLIDERMNALTHKMKSHAQSMVTAMDTVTARINQQEESIVLLGEKDHTIDMKLLREIKDLQLEIVRTTATKSDLSNHQAQMAGQVRDLREDIRKEMRQ